MSDKNESKTDFNPEDDKLSPEDLNKTARSLRERLAAGSDEIRKSIETRLQDASEAIAGPIAHQATEFIMLLPRLVVLLYKLFRDKRVSLRLRIFVGAVLAYVISPIDLMPELILGPIGLLDDFVLVVFAIDLLFSETDQEIIYGHWDGDDNLLTIIQESLALVEYIVPDRVLARIRKWVSKRTARA